MAANLDLPVQAPEQDDLAIGAAQPAVAAQEGPLPPPGDEARGREFRPVPIAPRQTFAGDQELSRNARRQRGEGVVDDMHADIGQGLADGDDFGVGSLLAEGDVGPAFRRAIEVQQPRRGPRGEEPAQHCQGQGLAADAPQADRVHGGHDAACVLEQEVQQGGHGQQALGAHRLDRRGKAPGIAGGFRVQQRERPPGQERAEDLRQVVAEIDGCPGHAALGLAIGQGLPLPEQPVDQGAAGELHAVGPPRRARGEEQHDDILVLAQRLFPGREVLPFGGIALHGARRQGDRAGPASDHLRRGVFQDLRHPFGRLVRRERHEVRAAAPHGQHGRHQVGVARQKDRRGAAGPEALLDKGGRGPAHQPVERREAE